jgi:hypothetical protein
MSLDLKRNLLIGRLLAACFCLMPSLQGQQIEYKNGNGISFRYPSNWKVEREEQSFTFKSDRLHEPYTFVALRPADNSDAAIFLWHRKLRPGLLCGTVQQQFQRFFIGEDSSVLSYFDQRDIIERFNAGTVFTVKSVRSLKHPGTETLASTVCGSAGDAAYIFFGYSVNYPPQARDVLISTLSFQNGKPTLLGDWNGPGGILTFNDDGNVTISFASGLKNRGTYRIAQGRIVFSWEVLMSVRTSAQWDCGYALGGERLALTCNGGSEMGYHR